MKLLKEEIRDFINYKVCPIFNVGDVYRCDNSQMVRTDSGL